MAFSIDLDNKVVLVTGAARGIGRAISLRLAQAGATVAVHYASRDATEFAKELGNGARAFAADLSDPMAGQRLVGEVVAHFGRVHAVVNNAGVALESSPTADPNAALAVWQQTLNVNLVAAGMISQAAINHFCEHNGGRLVHIASRAAFRGDLPEYVAYAASKGGMVAMSRSFARYYGKQGVTSFVIAPGFTRTDMAEAIIADIGEDVAMDGIALNRLTEPDDIAPLVVMLVSGLADHATGTSIDINAASYVR